MGPTWDGQYISDVGTADNTAWVWYQGVSDGYTVWDADELYTYIINSQNPIYDQWNETSNPAEVRGWIESGADPNFHAWLGGEPFPVPGSGGTTTLGAGTSAAVGNNLFNTTQASQDISMDTGAPAEPPAPPPPSQAEILMFNEYDSNGILYKSNLPAVNTRDENGNIILQEDSQNNNPIIFESVKKNYRNKSIVDAIDTQFKYFKFPARTTTTGASDIDFMMMSDPAFARYAPFEDHILTSASPHTYTGIWMDNTIIGTPRPGVGGASNSYQIAQDVKNSGIDLRFRVQIAHSVLDTVQTLSGEGVWVPGGCDDISFSIIKQGPNFPLSHESRKFRLFSIVNARAGLGIRGTPGAPWDPDGYSNIRGGEDWDMCCSGDGVVYANLDTIIPNDQFEIGDLFNIGVRYNTGDFHKLYAVQSFFVVSDAAKNVNLWGQTPEQVAAGNEVQSNPVLPTLPSTELIELKVINEINESIS